MHNHEGAYRHLHYNLPASFNISLLLSLLISFHIPTFIPTFIFLHLFIMKVGFEIKCHPFSLIFQLSLLLLTVCVFSSYS